MEGVYRDDVNIRWEMGVKGNFFRRFDGGLARDDGSDFGC